ncbi:MAG: metal ABC transporter permease [Candidatus Babeliales bacterium]
MINLQIIFALIIATFIGGIAGYIGSLMVTKRMALVGGAFGHLTIPGVTLAVIYDLDVSLGALLFLFVGIILIWFLEQRTKLPMEALTSVVFSSSLAVAFLFLPEEKTMQVLIGDISKISIQVTFITVILSIIIFFVIKKIYSGLVLMSVSNDIASSIHINIKLYNFTYLISIALVVALGVRIVGGLMTAALVAIPACTSRNFSKNLFQYSYLSLFLGSLASFLGTLLFIVFGFSAGPLIIIFSSFFFFISLFFKKN